MRIAVTRLEGKETEDRRRCRKYGHDCYPVSPMRAEFVPEEIERFLLVLETEGFDCLFFTSVIPAKKIAPAIRQWPRTIAIGPQTASVLAEHAPAVETLPRYYSKEFAPWLGGWLEGKRIGIPRADVPNDELLDAIRGAGGIPLEFRIYRLIPTGEELDTDRAEALLFTSAGSYRHARWRRRPDLLIMAIGEVTARAMQQGGDVPAVTGNGSLEGTLRSLNRYLGEHGGGRE